MLNELDWWISDQWETFETEFQFSQINNKYRALRRTNMKEMFIVRYADDFKMFSRNNQTSIKVFHAVEGYLKSNLKLDISLEKSQVTNLRKKKSDFLGFSLKAKKKSDNKHVALTFVMDKRKEKIKTRVKELVTDIQLSPTPKTVNKYNIYVMGNKISPPQGAEY